MDQLLQIVDYIIRLLERAPGEWLLVFIVAAFFLGKHGGQIDNWLLDITRFVLSAVLAVFVENALGRMELIGAPRALGPEAPTPALVSILIFLVIFVGVFFVVGWILGS